MNTTLTRTRGTDQLAEGADAASPPDGGSTRGRQVIRVGFPVVVVGAFIALAWTAEWFREALGWLAPHLSILLWGAVAAVLAVSLIRRGIDRSLGDEWVRPVRFLAAPAALGASIIAYLVQLFASWNTGGASWFTVGGVVPLSDANGYFGGAERLLFDGHLDAFNSRRPLHAAFLASELAFTNLDLRKALVIQAVLLGVASYLAARAVTRDLGPVAGLALFAGIYGFARVGIHTVSTETLGVTLGALAFAALWSAVRRQDEWLVAGGLFLLTFAFNFRPGPLLLLLTLPVALAWLLRGSRWINWRVLGLSAAAVVVALSANYVSIFTFHGEADDLNANANYTIYGMAKGLPGWSSEPVSWYQIFVDHPEIRDMSETERNRVASEKAREELKAHPGEFASSYIEGAGNYFRVSADYIMEPVPTGALRILVYASALVLAAVVLIARWRASWRRVLLDVVLFGGVVFALPTFVGAWPYDDHAPWGWGPVGTGSYFTWWFGAAAAALAYVAFIVVGTERLRVDRQLWLVAVALATVVVMMPILGNDTVRFFAAAVPFLALSVALAVAAIDRIPFPRVDATVRLSAAEKKGESRVSRWAPVAIGGAVAVVAVIGAPIAAAAIDKPAIPTRVCPDGRRAQPLIGGAAVRLVEPGAQSDLGELEAREVKRSRTIEWLQEKGEFGPIHSNTTVIGGLTQRGHDRIAFVDGAVSAPRRSVLYLCGTTVSDNRTNALLKEWPLPLDVFAGSRINAVSSDAP
jgi:hypothetical protein